MLPIPVELVEAVVHIESRDNDMAVSNVGAKGDMQLMDNTGREWCARLKLGEYDPFNAEQNRAIGTAYLSYLVNRYHSYRLGLAAYNWGLGNVDKAIRNLPEKDWQYSKESMPECVRKYVGDVCEQWRLRNCAGGRETEHPSLDTKNTYQPGYSLFTRFSEQFFPGFKGETMIEKIKQWIAGSIGTSIIRKLMTFVSGFLVGTIGLDPATATTFSDSATKVLVAMLLYGIAQLWSFAEKKKTTIQ